VRYFRTSEATLQQFCGVCYSKLLLTEVLIELGKGKIILVIALTIVWGFNAWGLDAFFRISDIYQFRFYTDIFQIGLLLAVLSLVNAIFTLPSGRIADIFGRKRLIIVAYVGLAVTFFAYTFAGGSNSIVPNDQILLLLYVIGFARMFFTALAYIGNLAWIVDQTTEKNRGKMVSLYTMLSSIGVIGGPAVVGVLYALYGANMAFTIVALMQFLIAIPILSIPETERLRTGKTDKIGGAQKHETLRGVKEIIHDRPLLALGVSAMFSSSLGIILLFYVQPLFTGAPYYLPLALTSIPMAIEGVFTMIGFVVAGVMIDRKKSKRGILIASLIITELPIAVLLLTPYLAFMQNIVALIVFIGFIGLGQGLTTPTFLVIANALAPKGERGTELGVYQGITNFCNPIGYASGGYFASTIGFTGIMLAGGVYTLASLLFVVAVLRKSMLAARGIK
jgi:MFS family permease